MLLKSYNNILFPLLIYFNLLFYSILLFWHGKCLYRIARSFDKNSKELSHIKSTKIITKTIVKKRDSKGWQCTVVSGSAQY